MKHWHNFIAFGFCMGLAIAAAIIGAWKAFGMGIICATAQLPFMLDK